MNYDFTSILERKGHDAIAVDSLGKMPGFAPELPDEGFDPIPMWVADMNFPACPSITQALMERIGHPAGALIAFRRPLRVYRCTAFHLRGSCSPSWYRSYKAASLLSVAT